MILRACSKEDDDTLLVPPDGDIAPALRLGFTCFVRRIGRPDDAKPNYLEWPSDFLYVKVTDSCLRARAHGRMDARTDVT